MITIKINPIGKNQTEVSIYAGYTILISYNQPVAYISDCANVGYISDTLTPTSKKHVQYWLKSKGMYFNDCSIQSQSFFDNLLKLSIAD